MTPTRNLQGTLVDLLDRVLDKGVVINADLIISLAGIPLIGVQVRAALAGMETMIKWGVMQDWDNRTRAGETFIRGQRAKVLLQGETPFLKMVGACLNATGLYTTWQYGHLYVTDQRVLLHHDGFGKVLFQAPFTDIRGIGSWVEDEGEEPHPKEICMVLQGGERVRLRASDPHQLISTLACRMEALGIQCETDLGGDPIFHQHLAKAH